MTSVRDRSLVTTGEHSLGARYRLLLFLALATVFWERLWVCVWKPVLVAASLAALILLDLLPALPGWLHLMLLGVFAVLFGGLSYRALRGFRVVGWSDARRRLEHDNDLEHRPLSALADRPVSAQDSLSLKVWQAHVRALPAQVHGLILRLPSPGLAAHDPFAIRSLVLLGLVVGVIVGHGEAGSRLARAFTFGGGVADRFSVEIWLTPPPYSRRSPIFLSNEVQNADRDKQNRITVLEGSTLSAHVTGRPDWYAAEPVLEIDDRVILLSAIGGPENNNRESFRGETILGSIGDGLQWLGVRANGANVASWQLAVIPDAPPAVEFSGAAQPDSQSRLGLTYMASDDYGVEGLTLEMRLQDRTLLAGDQISNLDVPVPGAPSRRLLIKAQSALDLTAHAWAGLPVQLHLIAHDGAGQKGTSEVVKLVLPERKFNHPVARAIIVQRRRLALLEANSRHKIENDIIVGLELIKKKTQAYDDATVVYLALGVAQARLRHSGDDGKYTAVMDLLWNIAISLEDGGIAVAERELDQAREALRNALENNAGSAEIDRLMDNVSQALENYLMALAEKLRAEGGTELQIDPLMQMLGASDLRDMLDKARELAQTGATDAARQMLSELDRVLDSVQGALQGSSSMAAMNEALNKFGEMLGRVRQLTDQQQNLLDDTFARSNKNNGDIASGQSSGNAAAQQALRNELGKLMLDADELLGTIPPTLGQADRHMTGAVQALGQGDLPGGMERQAGALESLRQAARDMSDQMAQMMAGAFGFAPGAGAGGQIPGGRDPFGRMTGQGGAMPGGAVGIPERGQIHRSRQILDELRRRAGQNRRPKQERDYIDRLLDKF